MPIDVRQSPELQAAILGIRAANRDLRRRIYADARANVGGLWTPALERRASTTLDRRVILKGARVAVGTSGFTVKAATSRKALSGGLIPANQWPAVEFGARRRKATFPSTSRKGRRYMVTRTINRGLPGRVPHGRIAFDAASEIGTKLVGSFVTSIVTTYQESVDG